MVRNQQTQPSRFYDLATGGGLPLQLQPVGAEFLLLRQFGYRDPHHDDPFVIPKDPPATGIVALKPRWYWPPSVLGTLLVIITLGGC